MRRIRINFLALMLVSLLSFTGYCGNFVLAATDEIIYDKEIFNENFEKDRINYLLSWKKGYTSLLTPQIVTEKNEGISNSENKVVKIAKTTDEAVDNYFRIGAGETSEAASIHHLFKNSPDMLKQIKLSIDVYMKDKVPTFAIKGTDTLSGESTITENLLEFQSNKITFTDESFIYCDCNKWYTFELYLDFNRDTFDVKIISGNNEVIKTNLPINGNAACINSFGIVPKYTGGSYTLYADNMNFSIPSENIDNGQNAMPVELKLSNVEKNEIYDALNGSIAVMNFAENAVKGGEVIKISNKLITDENGNIAPLGLYEEVLEALVNTAGGKIELTINGVTIDFCDDAVIYNGGIYLPLNIVLTAFGINFEQYEMVTIIGDREYADLFKNNSLLMNKLKLLLNERNVSYNEVTKEDWKLIKDNWRKYLLGDEHNNTSDEWVKNNIDNIDSACEEAMELFNQETQIFAVFGTSPVTTTREMTYQYEYVLDLATAFGIYGSKYYKNSEIKEMILFSLEWLYQNLYGQTVLDGNGWKRTSEYNWSDWFEKTPRALCNTLLILEDELTEELIHKYISPYLEIRTRMKRELSPSNGLSRMYVGTLAAALLEDYDRMTNAAYDYELNLNSPEGEQGIQDDWQYITHNYFAYTSIYGAEALLGRLPVVQTILSGTKFEISSPYKYNSCQWIYETFDPVMFYGNLTNAQAGRGHGNEASNTDYAISTALGYIGIFGKDDDYKLKQFIKRHTTDSNLDLILEGLNIDSLTKLRQVLSDDSVEVEPHYRSKIYYTGDSVMHHRGNFGFALSMSSTRIAKWESINGANIDGWYRGDGMLYLYLEDNPDYGASYFNGLNRYHLPGTTIDTQKRTPASISNSAETLANQDFVGGATIDDSYSTVAMQFEDYHNDNINANVVTNSGHGGDAPYHQSSLMAKKAWFMFDDEVVCLGTDVNANDGFEVHTVVENRKLGKKDNSGILGTEDITVDGNVLEKASTYRKTFENPTWAHIEGVSGYYFPQGGTLEMDKVTNRNNFLEMWLNHGVSPENSTYAYVILPTKTSGQTAEYTENPDIEIKANTEKVQVVKEKNLNLCGMIFWESGKFENISVSEPMVIMSGREGGKLKLSIADPTQLKTSATITIEGKYELLNCDDALSVQSDGGKTTITVDFSNASGKSLPVTLKEVGRIDVAETENTVTVKAVDYCESVLYIIKYEGDKIVKIGSKKTTFAEGIYSTLYTFNVENDVTYKFLLFNKNTVTPVCKSVSY